MPSFYSDIENSSTNWMELDSVFAYTRYKRNPGLRIPSKIMAQSNRNTGLESGE